MGDHPVVPNLEPILRFNPKWWWDPIPPWLLDRLDRAAVAQLALAQLELQRTVLEGQLKANERTMEVIKRFGQ